MRHSRSLGELASLPLATFGDRIGTGLFPEGPYRSELAAWNERRLVRDLYDVWFFLQMGVKPDEDTLRDRLGKPVYSRLVKPEERFTGASLDDFYDFVRERVSQLTDADIAYELSDYLPADELLGLAMQFRSAFVRLH